MGRDTLIYRKKFASFEEAQKEVSRLRELGLKAQTVFVRNTKEKA